MLRCRAFSNAGNGTSFQRFTIIPVIYRDIDLRNRIPGCPNLFRCTRPNAPCLALPQCAAVAPAPCHPKLSHEVSETDGFDPELLASSAGVQRQVQCGPTPLGRGLVATTALERQAIVSVPLQNTLVITDEPLSGISVFGDRCQELWQQHHGRLPQELLDFLTGEARWDVRMTAWLLWVASELPDSSVWGPYLASLPQAEEVTCLLTYGPDDVRELQFPELVEEAKAQHKWALAVHQNYFDPQRGELRKLRLATRLEDTLWAMSMVRTRTFSEDVNGESLTLVVPYADMANHSFDFNSTFCMARDNKRFELRLLSPLGAGQEATICYGESKPNFEVMRDYGFVVPGNPNDRIVLPDQDTLPALNGASLLQSLGLEGDWRGSKPTIKEMTSHQQQHQQQRQQHLQQQQQQGGKEEAEAAAPQAEVDGEARLAVTRRRCAVLSMRLSDGFPSEKGGGGGLFGGWPAARAWTDAGRPPPQHVRGGAAAVAAERTSVAMVRQSYQNTLEALPTSISEDEAELASRSRWGTAAGSREGHIAESPALTARQEAAVRCRLEHKRLLREAVRALDVYDMWLAERQRLR